MADNIRPALYGAEYTVETVEDLTDRKKEVITIAGKYCESGDLLAKNIELPENYAILAERFAIKKGSRSPRVANQFLEGLFS